MKRSLLHHIDASRSFQEEQGEESKEREDGRSDSTEKNIRANTKEEKLEELKRSQGLSSTSDSSHDNSRHVRELLVPSASVASKRAGKEVEESVDQSIARLKLKLLRLSHTEESKIERIKCTNSTNSPSFKDSNNNVEKEGLASQRGRKYYDYTPRSAQSDNEVEEFQLETTRSHQGQGYLSCSVFTPRRAQTCEQKIIRLADELGASSLSFLRVVKMYLNRVIKHSWSQEQILNHAQSLLVKALEVVLQANQRNMHCFCPAIEKPRQPVTQSIAPPPPPKVDLSADEYVAHTNRPVVRNRLLKLFPINHGIANHNVKRGRPTIAPPSAFKRPPGRARTISMLFADIVTYLSGSEIVALSQTCGGLWSYCATERTVVCQWPILAKHQFGVNGSYIKDDSSASQPRSLSIGKHEFARLWTLKKNACLLLCGPIGDDLMERFINDKVSGVYHTMAIDRFVPCGQTETISAAEAIFCAARACSPCLVHIRDPWLLENVEVESIKNATAEGMLRGVNQKHRRHLTWLEIRYLCRLVQRDLSSDAVVIVCHATNPWKVPQEILDVMRPINVSEGLEEDSHNSHNSNQETMGDGISMSGDFSQDDSGQLDLVRKSLFYDLLKDKLAQTAPELIDHDLDSIHGAALHLLRVHEPSLLVRRLMDVAASKMLDRLRQSKYFVQVRGKFQVCKPDTPGAKYFESFSDLPITSVRYGPYLANDYFAAVELIRLDKPHKHHDPTQRQGRGANAHQNTNNPKKQAYRRRLADWLRTTSLGVP